jgi:hypothetical protein
VLHINLDTAIPKSEAYDESSPFAIVPMFYEERNRYIDVMRQAIALNGSFSRRSR